MATITLYPATWAIVEETPNGSYPPLVSGYPLSNDFTSTSYYAQVWSYQDSGGTFHQGRLDYHFELPAGTINSVSPRARVMLTNNGSATSGGLVLNNVDTSGEDGFEPSAAPGTLPLGTATNITSWNDLSGSNGATVSVYRRKVNADSGAAGYRVRVYTIVLDVDYDPAPAPEPSGRVGEPTSTTALAYPSLPLTETRWLAGQIPAAPSMVIWDIDEEGNQTVGPVPSTPVDGYGFSRVSESMFLTNSQGNLGSGISPKSWGVAEDGTITLLATGPSTSTLDPAYYYSVMYYHDGTCWAMGRQNVGTQWKAYTLTLNKTTGAFGASWVAAPFSPWTPTTATQPGSDSGSAYLTSDQSVALGAAGTGNFYSTAFSPEDPHDVFSYSNPSVGTNYTLGIGPHASLTGRQYWVRDPESGGLLIERPVYGYLSDGPRWVQTWGWSGSAIEVLDSARQPLYSPHIPGGYLTDVSPAWVGDGKVASGLQVRDNPLEYSGAHLGSAIVYDLFGDPEIVEVDDLGAFECYVQVVGSIPSTGAMFGFRETYATEDDYNNDILTYEMLIWPVTRPFWRNLAINPSGEQSYNRAWVGSNGTVETAVDWEV